MADYGLPAYDAGVLTGSRLLADFYDLDRLVELSLQVLRDPQSHGCLGEAGTALIDEKYAVKRTLPQMVEFFQTAAGENGTGEKTKGRPG